MNFRAQFTHVWSTDLPIAIVVFSLVVGVLFFALWRFRARPGRLPSRQSKHPRLEAAWILSVLGMAVFLMVLSTTANAQEFHGNPAPSMHVNITAFQWCWKASYPGTSVTVTGDCLNGRDPVVVLPVGETIEVDLTSNDVVHELWIPYFRFKMEAFPDHWNHFPLTLTHTGTWVGRCSEFCGLYHDRMDLYVKGVSKAAFQKWLTQHGATGAPK